MKSVRSQSVLLVLALVAAACGSGDSGAAALPEDALVLMVSSDLDVGTHRLAIGAVSPDGTNLVEPDTEVTVEMFREDGTPAGVIPASFIWAIPDVRGMWVANYTFDAPGNWQLGVRTADGTLTRGPAFQVLADAPSIVVGEMAPASITKTTADGALAAITTDVSPDPGFYDLTVADAVTSGNPSVIVFATPAFCVSATCAPSLDVVKRAASDHPDVEFVHVEVFDNLDAASREDLIPVPAITEWGLTTEPWVYVVDAGGVVTARFEGALGEAEFADALAAVSG